MIKFKKTKRAKSRTNINNKADEIVTVLDQLINLIKVQQEQINNIKTAFNDHYHCSGGTRGPIDQIFI